MASFEELYPSMAKKLFQEPQEPELVPVDGGARHSPEEIAANYYTVAEAAEALRVVRMTVYRMIERGDLGATKVGKVYRIHKRDLTKVLEQKEKK